MIQDDETDLARFDDDFAAAPVEEKEFGDIPDGKYRVAVDRVEIATTKRSKTPALKWRLRIFDGQYRGRILFRTSVLSSPQTIAWLKRDLHLCGVDLQKFSELPSELERLLDVELEVTKRTKGDFENVYFNKRLDGGSARPSGPTDGGDDDIAF